MSSDTSTQTVTRSSIESRSGFDWLFKETKGEPQYKSVIPIRDYLENEIPETRSTFTVPKLFEWVDAPHTHDSIDRRFIPLVGSWKLPQTLTGSAGSDGRTKFVNPRWPHRHRYSDLIVRCECGAPVTYQGNGMHDTDGADGDREHADDCRTSWRLSARARLAELRREVLIEMLENGHRGNDLVMRLRFSESSEASLSWYFDAHSIDAEAIREDYLRRRANALTRLVARVGTVDAGKVFGIARSTVGNVVRNHTGASLTTLKQMEMPEGY